MLFSQCLGLFQKYHMGVLDFFVPFYPINTVWVFFLFLFFLYSDFKIDPLNLNPTYKVKIRSSFGLKRGPHFAIFRECIIGHTASVHPFNPKLCIYECVHQCVSTTGNRMEDNRQGEFLTEQACKCLQTSVSNNRCSHPLPLGKRVNEMVFIIW